MSERNPKRGSTNQEKKRKKSSHRKGIPDH